MLKTTSFCNFPCLATTKTIKTKTNSSIFFHSGHLTHVTGYDSFNSKSRIFSIIYNSENWQILKFISVKILRNTEKFRKSENKVSKKCNEYWPYLDYTRLCLNFSQFSTHVKNSQSGIIKVTSYFPTRSQNKIQQTY